MLGVAQQFVTAAYAAASANNWNLVQSLETAADVSLQIAAMPVGSRAATTVRFMHESVKHDVTVDPNAADPFASFTDHSKGQDLAGAIVEGVVGVVVNILAVIPVTAPVFAPIAVAWDVAEAGKNFAEGNVLGGFLSLAAAAGTGFAGLGAIADNGVAVGGFESWRLLWSVKLANPKYFGAGRGITYYNLVSDRFTGLNAIVVPGTLRDSLVILGLLLGKETDLAPTEIMTDTAAYADTVFGLFWLLGYQLSPRLADIGDARFWRIDKTADSLGLTLNAIALWNSTYIQAAINQLTQEGWSISDADVARVSPLLVKHINFLG